MLAGHSSWESSCIFLGSVCALPGNFRRQLTHTAQSSTARGIELCLHRGTPLQERADFALLPRRFEAAAKQSRLEAGKESPASSALRRTAQMRCTSKASFEFSNLLLNLSPTVALDFPGITTNLNLVSSGCTGRCLTQQILGSLLKRKGHTRGSVTAHTGKVPLMTLSLAGGCCRCSSAPQQTEDAIHSVQGKGRRELEMEAMVKQAGLHLQAPGGNTKHCSRRPNFSASGGSSNWYLAFSSGCSACLLRCGGHTWYRYL